MEGPDLNPKVLTGTRLPFNAANLSQSCRHQSMQSRLRMLMTRFKRGCSRVISTWTDSSPQPYNTGSITNILSSHTTLDRVFFIPFTFTFLWVTTLASFFFLRRNNEQNDQLGNKQKKSTTGYDPDAKSETSFPPFFFLTKSHKVFGYYFMMYKYPVLNEKWSSRSLVASFSFFFCIIQVMAIFSTLGWVGGRRIFA